MKTGLLPRFFNQVTRQAFGDLALDDPPAARYLADVLTRFARADALYAVREAPPRRLDTVVDSLLAIQRAWEWDSPDFSPEDEPALRRHIGDYTMFMTGVFREWVERRGIMAYYEAEGRRSYRFVWEMARTQGDEDAPVFRRLSDRFEHYAGALSYARKVYMRADRLPPEAGDQPFFRVLHTE